MSAPSAVQPHGVGPESGPQLILTLKAVARRGWRHVLLGRCSKRPEGSIDLTTVFGGVVEAAERVNRGDLSHVDAMLTAQAVTLNAMFVDLARRAHLSKRLDYEDHYLKLAFRAQSQCRTTAEALAELKNPPLFTRQANIAGPPDGYVAIDDVEADVSAIPKPATGTLLLVRLGLLARRNRRRA